MAHDLSGLEFTVRKTDALSDGEWEKVRGLFETSYRQANLAYLERSLEKLHYVARAHHGGGLAGFALGETRVMDLPRLPAQVVSLAGICCIVPEFRRYGLWGELMRVTLGAGEVPEAPRRLVCGRMAHPAAMRIMTGHPTVVPKPGARPTRWQQEVGQAVAEAYAVHAFDPETFVCIGDGEPIGYPNIEIEVEPIEWEIFKPVNRDRGDSLLGIIWGPDAPPGW
jgi:hypothetical protein